MPGDILTDAQGELNRLRGQRQDRLDAANAKAARLAEIEQSQTRGANWSPSEVEFWQGRDIRARRRAAVEAHDRWQARLRKNEPVRKKLAARLAELAAERSAAVACHRTVLDDLNRRDSELRAQLNALEAPETPEQDAV